MFARTGLSRLNDALMRRLPGALIVAALLPAVLLVAVLLPAAAAQSSSLGRIDFPTSGSPEAQVHFHKGALLLHSFEFDDAREEFQKAHQIDPGFALAYWGEALTHHKLLWQQHDQKAGQAALEKLAPAADARLAKPPPNAKKDTSEPSRLCSSARATKRRGPKPTRTPWGGWPAGSPMISKRPVSTPWRSWDR